MSDVLALRSRIRSLFGSSGRTDGTVVIAFVLIHALLLLNAIRHSPSVQYDAEGHQQYISVLADLRIPWSADTKEYFSPPTPYVLPAALIVAGMNPLLAMKTAQIVNVGLSAALVLYLLALCEALRPQERTLKLSVLAAVALFPVYFRTFTMVRGEPFVALFATAAAFHAYSLVAAILADAPRRARAHTLALGAALGFAAISRQWGLFLIPAVTLFVVAVAVARPGRFMTLLRSLVIAGAMTVVVGAWWYAGLYWRFGTVTAFNRGGSGFSLHNQPGEFYVGTGSGKLFNDPVRPSFSNQLVPIFYSDTWGDYWGFFLVRGTDTRTGEVLRPAQLASIMEEGTMPEWLQTNRRSIAPYLGRVNAVALLPSLFIIAALGFGLASLWRLLRGATDPVQVCASLLTLILLCSAAGYLWFLVKYPILGKGDTIKASYMLHAFPCLAALVGLWANQVVTRWPRARYALGIAAAIVIAHNLPAMISRYS